jgi:uncharacterized membrane protein
MNRITSGYNRENLAAGEAFMSIAEVHARLGNTALFFTAILAIWGLWRYFRGQGVSSSYWGALVIAEVLYLLQAGLGAFVYFSGAGQLPKPYIHILYGVVAVITIPGAFVYTHGDDQRRSMLVYGLGLLFLVGIILRSAATGS